MRDGRAYLSFLSDFWTSLWQDSKTLSTLIGAQVEILNRLFLQSVAIAAEDWIDDLPLFREDFWHLVYFGEKSRVGQYAYRLPNRYHEVPFLYDRMFDPSLMLRAGRDYRLEQREDETVVVFNEDPFTNPRMPIRDMGDQKQILFFAPKVYLDENDLFELYGHLVNIVRPTSEQYRQLVKGVMFIYAHGPILHPLNAGLSLAAGYPVSRDFDRVVGITSDGENYLLTTEKSHLYRVPLVATLSVEAGSQLRPLSTFIRDIQIMDYLSEPYWWRGGEKRPGETDEDVERRRVVNYLSPELVPDLNEILRDDPEVIDYLFDEYLKYNVLGLRLNTLALGNFNAIEEFFQVLYEVKPHYISPYTNSYFKVNEVWDVPQEVIEIVEAIELTRGLRSDDPVDAAEHWTFPVKIHLGANLKIGLSRDNLGVLEDTARDRPYLHAGIEPIERNMIAGDRVVMNSRRVVGGYPDGGVFEKITLSAVMDLVDTVEFSGDRVQIVVQVEGEEPVVLGDELVS